jgi:hypothetical protein
VSNSKRFAPRQARLANASDSIAAFQCLGVHPLRAVNAGRQSGRYAPLSCSVLSNVPLCVEARTPATKPLGAQDGDKRFHHQIKVVVDE